MKILVIRRASDMTKGQAIRSFAAYTIHSCLYASRCLVSSTGIRYLTFRKTLRIPLYGQFWPLALVWPATSEGRREPWVRANTSVNRKKAQSESLKKPADWNNPRRTGRQTPDIVAPNILQ
jgi:hypothetical protein